MSDMSLNALRAAYGLPELAPRAMSDSSFDKTAIAKFFDVPPWLISSDCELPRFASLRWRLRRVPLARLAIGDAQSLRGLR